MNVRVSRCLKEELACSIDKWFWLIIKCNISYTTKNLKNKAIFNLKQYCMRCYMTLSNVFWLIAYKDVHPFFTAKKVGWPVIRYVYVLSGCQ